MTGSAPGCTSAMRCTGCYGGGWRLIRKPRRAFSRIASRNGSAAKASRWPRSGKRPAASSRSLILHTRLGRTHRDNAPELEWGGTTDDFMTGEPFDPLCFEGIQEEIAGMTTGAEDGRAGLRNVATMLGDCVGTVQKGIESVNVERAPEMQRKRLKALLTGLKMLTHLGTYYQGRFLSAYDLAFIENRTGNAASTPQLLQDFHIAVDGWEGLSTSPEANFYKPFTECLRMKTNDFHWKSALPRITAEADMLAKLPKVDAQSPKNATGMDLPKEAKLTWKTQENMTECSDPGERPGPGMASRNRSPV